MSNSDDLLVQGSQELSLSDGRDHPDDPDGLVIHISISYKTLLIVFALFGLTERVVSALLDNFCC
jgi:hypothetical protein